MTLRYVVALAILLAGVVLIELLGPFHNEDDVLLFALIGGPCLLAGLVAGRWPALWLALVPLALVIPAAISDEESEMAPEAVIALTAIITVPYCSAALAVGIAARKGIESHRHRGSAEPPPSAG